MVHLRLNEKEANPNPHINFITALSEFGDHDEARQLLRALAAQVRPVMKAEGFEVNSFIEYEHNRVFLGRNWNNGEVVELVLRNAEGRFVPPSWLLNTLCHELAHIKVNLHARLNKSNCSLVMQHMNHGREFQALWRKLNNEVRQLQLKGYYGDGYWSSGQRLADSARIAATMNDEEGFPEHLCGGAQRRQRPTATRRRRTGGPRKATAPSLHTGAQTAKKRKAGARVTSKYAFQGEGTSLGESVTVSAGFGKRTQTKQAREERAAALERRLAAMKGETSTAGAEEIEDSDEDEIVPESDEQRRQMLKDAMEDSDIEFVEDDDEEAPRRFGTNFIFGQERSPPPPPPERSSIVAAEVGFRKKEALGLAGSSSRKLGQAPSKTQWTCEACTLLNEPMHLACAACETTRRHYQ